MARLLARLRDADFLTADWVQRRARTLLAVNLLLGAAAGVVLFRPAPGGERVWVDFVSFYAAGTLADASRPASAYDEAEHRRAEIAAAGPGRPYQFFFYPPPFLLLCAALAALPYPLAFALFEGLSLGLFLLVMRGVTGPPARGRWLLPVLAFTPLFWGIALGQNALLTAALLGGGVLLVDRRPVLAGLLFGALCYKPHLGLLVPVALAASRRWPGFAAAACSALLLCAASWLLFGTAAWEAYLRRFSGSGEIYGSGRISFAGMASPFGALRLLGIPNGAALALQVAAALAGAALVAWIWARGASLAVRGAALLSATLLAVPVVLFYDQLLLLVAIGWLACEGRSLGFRRWEKPVLLASFLLPIVSLPLAIVLALPLAPIPAALLLGLCASRASARQPAHRAAAASLALASG